MEDNTKRLIVMSILAYAIGTFIFAAGLMTKTAVSIILFYIIASILIICGILALYNNYKKNPPLLPGPEAIRKDCSEANDVQHYLH